jgi:hypothetical protein
MLAATHHSRPDKPALAQYGRPVTHEQVRARVEAFVADFHQRWQRSGRMPTDFTSHPSFEVWAAELEQLARTHGTAVFRTGVEGSFSSHPAHEPGAETITDVHVEAERARVRTEIASGGVTAYYEYRLVRVDDEVRIDELLSYLDPPGAPLVEAGEADRLLALATSDANLAAISSDLQLDLPSLFAEGRQVTPHDERVPLEVHRLGDITLSSGVVAVRDFGYGNHSLEPLARRVPPGTYPIEVSRADHTNVALRMRLSEAPSVAWYRAERASGRNVVGVDYANVSITDLGSLLGCEAQHVEELYERYVVGLHTSPGTVFGLQGDIADAVVATSGFGDGGYPCYWGVAADGTLSELVVDFVVLAEDLRRVVTVPWRIGPLDDPEIECCALLVESGDGVFALSHNGAVTRLRVFGPSGSPVMDSDRLGSFTSEGRHGHMWRPAASPPEGSLLEVTVGQGYRHT